MGGRKDPYLKFWVDDWRASADLRACSLSARAVWLEMLLYMHRHSPRRGAMLLPSGAAMTAAQLARDIAASEAEVEAALGELIAQRVCSVDEGGVIYCRRMAAESDISAKRAAAGEAGAKARWDGKPDGKPDGKKMANTGSGSGSGNGIRSGSSEGVQGEGTHEPHQLYHHLTSLLDWWRWEPSAPDWCPAPRRTARLVERWPALVAAVAPDLTAAAPDLQERLRRYVIAAWESAWVSERRLSGAWLLGTDARAADAGELEQRVANILDGVGAEVVPLPDRRARGPSGFELAAEVAAEMEADFAAAEAARRG